ncbi:PLP-dependent aminotransferase family protein [Microbacterium lushaniae]|uniref:PLP-dependent aminotransferase family protein n=1 Tax=Microbacterium lushaniae TaxID=2614639 RepID=A0A5J6L4M8_9MICO|nr:PLP-dependent aminotransferase family protein [Microbacterium lushaniae]QEW03370.1 PLP-dependent aminotransferase family protein [Microbacterium lushaniae]
MSDSSSERITAELRSWIAAAPPGAQLPSTRSLTRSHGASPVTVQKALHTLTRQGLIETRPGVGTFVSRPRATRPHDYSWQTAALGAPAARLPQSTSLRQASPDVVGLHEGYPERDLLPHRMVRAALARAARGDVAVTRPPSSGVPELRAWFATELAAVTSAGLTAPTAKDVVVLPGSQSGLSTLFRSLVGARMPLLMESPTYWGAIGAAMQAGVEVVPVSSGAHGPDPGELDRALTETGARAFYAQPTYANPTGAQWSPSRADAVLRVIRAHGAFLIEDDWAHDFGISSTPSPLAARDDSGHVVYVRSLTKSVSPAIRVAGLIARGPAFERILADLQAHVLYVSGILQAAALDVVTQPGWRTHLRGVRQQLAARRDLLVEAVSTHLPSAHVEAVPAGGLNLWVQLPDDTDLPRLIRACEARGVAIAGGDDWFPAEPTGRFLRLNYSGPNPGAFPDAVRVIGECLAG